MTDQVAIVTFTTPASTGTLDITSPDITDTFSAAILIFTRQTTDDSNVAHGVIGMGFIGVDGTQGTNTLQSSIASQIEDGVISGQSCQTGRDSTVVIKASNGAAVATSQIVAAYSASISGGVRLNFTTTTVQAKCTAILFAGLAKAAAGDCTFNDAAGSHESVGVSPFFQPDVVIFRSSDNITNGDTPNATFALGFALNKTGIPQVSSYVNCDNGADPTDSDGFIRSDCCSGGFIGDRGVAMDRFQVTSFDSTGFNGIAIDTGGLNSPQANYLALKFTGAIRMAVANILTSGSTGNQSFTDAGFKPSFVLGMSSLMTTLDTLIDGATASSAGYFAFNRTYQRAYSACNQEGLNINPAVTVAKTRQGDHALLTLSDAAAVAQQADFTSFDRTGFSLNFSTATSGYLTVLMLALAVVEDETVSITETSSEVVTAQALRANETVGISETVVFASRIVFGEIVNILEAQEVVIENAVTIVASPYAGTVQAGAVVARTEQAGAERGGEA